MPDISFLGFGCSASAFPELADQYQLFRIWLMIRRSKKTSGTKRAIIMIALFITAIFAANPARITGNRCPCDSIVMVVLRMFDFGVFDVFIV